MKSNTAKKPSTPSTDFSRIDMAELLRRYHERQTVKARRKRQPMPPSESARARMILVHPYIVGAHYRNHPRRRH